MSRFSRSIRPIGGGMRAALTETFSASVALVPSPLREGFVLIGGTAMLLIGGGRSTEDVDIVVTPDALAAFTESAQQDPRFSQTPTESWIYTASNDINVPLEFLAMGGQFVPRIHSRCPALGGFRAGLADLALMKSWAVDSRGNDQDLEDLDFILGQMQSRNENLSDLTIDDDDIEVLKTAASGLAHASFMDSLLQERGWVT